MKILLVLACSIALFFVSTWWGMGALALTVGAVSAAARLDVGRIAHTLLPFAFILAVTLLANSFTFDVAAIDSSQSAAGLPAGPLAGGPPVALVGSFGFVPAGFERGCFVVLRIVLLLAASLVLTTTSTTTEISQALASFLGPLARVGVPVHDVVTVLSIALRFIPVTIDHVHQLRIAQTARGSAFDTGHLRDRLKAWSALFVPLFVGLFRHADTLALAMDTRCYGRGKATRLSTRRFTARQGALLVCGVALCALVGFFG